MRKINLTTWERVQLLACVPVQDTVSNVRKHIRIMDVLELSEDDQKLVGFTNVGQGFQWARDKQDYEFELTFEDSDLEHLVKLVEGRDDWPSSRLTAVLLDKILGGENA